MKTILLLLILVLPHLGIAQDTEKKPNPITNRAYIIAFERYPQIADSNSAMHKQVVSIYQRAYAAKSAVFSDPNWPLLIADKAYSSFGAINSEPRISPGPTEKYEQTIAKKQASKNATLRAVGNFEWAAYQAILIGDEVKAAEMRAQAEALMAQKAQAQEMTRALRSIDQTLQMGITVYIR